ncbi:MAG: fibronectin type III domain-containing protein [Spirochaetia bacterium]|jgi:hypothetical protein
MALIAAGALSIALASCDSYAVLDQFHKGSPLNLVLEAASVQQGATINLYPSGGTPPYSFGLLAGDFYYVGTLGSISGQTYTGGNAIGAVVIYLSDASGATVDAVVAIMPPTPGSFNVQPSGTNAIQISWSYGNLSLISGFLIQRSTDDVTFTSVTSQPNSATSYIDSPLNPNQTYYYRMYAVASTAANTYQSLPTGVLGSMP